MSVDPDGPLVERARGGDREAFAALVRRHQGRIHGLVARVLGDQERAAEVAQEVFVRAFMGLRRFRGEAAFGTWLYRIALNELRGTLRRRPRREPLPVVPASGDNPARRLQRRETAAQVRAVLAGLRPEERELLVLRDMEGLTYAEMAALLGKPLGSVKSALHRARLRFAERFRRLEAGGRPEG